MRKDSLDYNDFNSQLHALFHAGQALATKTKHFTPATSLCTAVLRISPPDVFDMQNAALIEQQVKAVKDKALRSGCCVAWKTFYWVRQEQCCGARVIYSQGLQA
jgi:hypothetical protein